MIIYVDAKQWRLWPRSGDFGGRRSGLGPHRAVFLDLTVLSLTGARPTDSCTQKNRKIRPFLLFVGKWRLSIRCGEAVSVVRLPGTDTEREGDRSSRVRCTTRRGDGIRDG
ncbi:hypothetical protein E2C01_037625 [Portunus trituberculatus]|uniref:Uncharacterized protein n=1 Tax=Portunus trituberculatus TaxID=210409 RepID=A0A5B7FF36_PORTR|nr:hypothetical protein [Portunus trituberculatus]